FELGHRRNLNILQYLHLVRFIGGVFELLHWFFIINFSLIWRRRWNQGFSGMHLSRRLYKEINLVTIFVIEMELLGGQCPRVFLFRSLGNNLDSFLQLKPLRRGQEFLSQVLTHSSSLFFLTMKTCKNKCRTTRRARFCSC